MSCSDGKECRINFVKKLEKLYPDLIQAEKGKIRNYHYSIAHINNNHIFWIFTYDKKGRCENELHGKIVHQDNPLITKYTGEKISESKIKKLLD
jgi:hypothetical protein